MASKIRVPPVPGTTGALLLGLALASCATGVVGRKDLLDFLVDDKTTCTEATGKLGEPAHVYEGRRLLAYRVNEDQEGRYRIVPLTAAGWTGVQQSLILVCDDAGILRMHALVRVKDK